MCYERNAVLIKDGELLTGTVNKSIIGTSEGSLIHVMNNDYGGDITIKFMNTIQLIVNYWLSSVGFSVGLKDILVSEEKTKQVEQIIKTSINEVDKIIMEDIPSRTAEIKILNVLNKARDESGGIIENYNDTINSSIIKMIDAGSKGSKVNISQMMSCVGQQSVFDGRIPNGYNERSLPYFTKFCRGAIARGFIASSYIKGLSPEEFFFHNMSGRQGLIDTACKTSETGYIQRRLMKSMEDIMIRYDYTVRNSQNEIIQYCYGNDNLDATRMESYNFTEILRYTNDEFKEIYYNPDQPNEFNTLISYKDMLNSFKLFGLSTDSMQIALNLDRIIKRNIRLYKSSWECFDSNYIIQKKEEFIQKDPSYKNNLLFTMAFSFSFASKIVLKIMNKQSFDYTLKEIDDRYYLSKIHPGEMVGAIAATSVGEPATQMTLNTFHSAGILEKNVTLGVPRFYIYFIL